MVEPLLSEPRWPLARKSGAQNFCRPHVLWPPNPLHLRIPNGLYTTVVGLHSCTCGVFPVLAQLFPLFLSSICPPSSPRREHRKMIRTQMSLGPPPGKFFHTVCIAMSSTVRCFRTTDSVFDYVRLGLRSQDLKEANVEHFQNLRGLPRTELALDV